MSLLDRGDDDDQPDQLADEHDQGQHMSLVDRASQLLLEPREDLACPECDALLEQGHVRDPRTQAHWRGVEALVCPEDGCDYAQRIGTGD